MATALLAPDPSMIKYGREPKPGDPPLPLLLAPEYEQALRNEMDFCMTVIERGVVPATTGIRASASLSQAEKALVVWQSLADRCTEVFPLSDEASRFIEKLNHPGQRLGVILLDVIGVYSRVVNKLEMIPEVKSSGVDVISLQSHVKLGQAMEIILKLALKSNLPSHLLGGTGEYFTSAGQRLLDQELTRQDYSNFIRASYYLEELLKLYSNPAFAIEIMGKNLNVFLAAAIHTSFAPLRALDSEHIKASMLSKPTRTSEQLVVRIKSRVRAKFEEISPLLPRSLLLRHLFLLQRNNVPKWFKRECRLIGCKIVTAPNGVKNLLVGLQDVFGEGRAEEAVKVVCNLLKAAVLEFKPPERSNILSGYCEQLFELIIEKSEHNKMCYDIQEVALRAGLMLLEFEPTFAKPLIWHRIFEPLLSLNFSVPNTRIQFEHITPAIGVLIVLQRAHKYSIDLQDSVFDIFRPVWSTIFKIYVCLGRFMAMPVKLLTTAELVERVFKVIQHLLGGYLSIIHCRGQPNLIDACLESIVFYDHEQRMVPVRYMIYHPGNSDEKDIVLKRDSCLDVAASWFTIVTEDTNAYLDTILRQQFVSNDMLGSLFTQLLGYEYNGLEEIATDGQNKDEDEPLPTTSRRPRFDQQEFSPSPFRVPTDPNITDMNEYYSMDLLNERELLRFITLRLLSGYGTEDNDLYGAMRSSLDQHSLVLCLLILKRSVQEMEQSRRLNMSFIFDSTMNSCLHTLKIMIECVRRPGEVDTAAMDIVCNWGDLDAFIPFLRKIADSKVPGVNGSVSQNMAEDTLIIIKTRGLGMNGKGSLPERSNYQRTLETLTHPAPFMKGAALIQLKKMIIEKNAEVLQNMQWVLQVVQREMRDSDSFVYLSAIGALAEIASLDPLMVIPILAREYAEGFEPDQPGTGTRAENRLKVAQTIYYVIRKLGDIAPKYSHFFLNAFLALLHDPDPSVRASGLSNLGQLTRVLRFTLPQVLSEMFDAACSVLDSDDDSLVRQGALTLILDSLKSIHEMPPGATTGIDGFGIHLRDVRRKAMAMREREFDHKCMHFLDAILSELNSIGKQLLTPSSSLEYKLRILSQH